MPTFNMMTAALEHIYSKSLNFAEFGDSPTTLQNLVISLQLCRIWWLHYNFAEFGGSITTLQNLVISLQLCRISWYHYNFELFGDCITALIIMLSFRSILPALF